MKALDYILIAAIALGIAAAIYFWVRLKKRGGGCCGNCSGCSCNCTKAKK